MTKRFLNLKNFAAATAIFAALAFAGCGVPDPDPDPNGPVDHDLTISEVIERVGPSMVNIETNTGGGSGIIFREDGYIITNDHVIRDTKTIVVYVGERKLSAKKIGTDRRKDIAVIKVEGKDLQPARFGDSDNVKKGDHVVAIGNSLGVHDTVKDGIVGNVNIEINTGETKNKYIQTNAEINHGNSGGGLVSLRAEVIGINDLSLTQGEGMHLAIPSNDAKKTAEELIAKTYVEYPYIGVECTNEQVKNTPLVVVKTVEPNSPAAKAGLKKGDALFKVNEATIATVADLREKIEENGSAKPMSIKYLRVVNKKLIQYEAQVTPKTLRTGFYTNDWS